MTYEKMAEMIKTDPEEFKDLIPILWKKCSTYLFKIAINFYESHLGLCERSGVDVEDLKAGCYEVFLKALEKFDPAKEYPLTSYFSVQFKGVSHRILNIDTERGYNDPLRNHVSTDAHYSNGSTGEACENTILDYVPDETPPVDTLIEDKLVNNPQRAKDRDIIRTAVKKLPSNCKNLIFLYYYDELPAEAVAKELGIKNSMVRSVRETALRFLRKDPALKEIHDRRCRERIIQSVNPDRAATLTEWAERERERRRKKNQ